MLICLAIKYLNDAIFEHCYLEKRLNVVKKKNYNININYNYPNFIIVINNIAEIT